MSKLRQLLSSIRVPKNLTDFESLESSTTLTINTPMSGGTDDSSDYGSLSDPSLGETGSRRDDTVDTVVEHPDFTEYNTQFRPPKQEKIIDLTEARRLMKIPQQTPQNRPSFWEKMCSCFCCCYSPPKHSIEDYRATSYGATASVTWGNSSHRSPPKYEALF